MRLTILGAPGSGKTTVTKALGKEFSAITFSSGDFARELAQTDGEVRHLLELGELPPIGDQLDEKVDYFLGSNAWVILDGYPRTEQQAHRICRRLDGIIILQCSDDKCIKRIMARGRWDGAAIKERLSIFHEQTVPAIGVLVSSDLPTITLCTEARSSEDVCNAIISMVRDIGRLSDVMRKNQKLVI